ncbi:MAG TPA: hypothetical protein VJ901_13250 [Thermoanaerobaculia bacterium]|nr:hypothetical protein [Thermoanaerobaculia bacterium]
MSDFLSTVAEDFRHGRETWPVRFVLCAVSLGIALVLQTAIR